jgi:hypothetical protein
MPAQPYQCAHQKIRGGGAGAPPERATPGPLPFKRLSFKLTQLSVTPGPTRSQPCRVRAAAESLSARRSESDYPSHRRIRVGPEPFGIIVPSDDAPSVGRRATPVSVRPAGCHTRTAATGSSTSVEQPPSSVTAGPGPPYGAASGPVPRCRCVPRRLGPGVCNSAPAWRCPATQRQWCRGKAVLRRPGPPVDAAGGPPPAGSSSRFAPLRMGEPQATQSNRIASYREPDSEPAPTPAAVGLQAVGLGLGASGLAWVTPGPAGHRDRDRAPGPGPLRALPGPGSGHRDRDTVTVTVPPARAH